MLEKTQLFSGLGRAELLSAVKCFEISEREYDKDAAILRAGDSTDRIGVILSGSISIVSNDFWGNRTIIEKMGEGRIFAETITFSSIKTLPFSVVTTEKTSILYLSSKKLLSPCAKACGVHEIIIVNMLTSLSDKNLLLAQKIEHLSKRTTREKILSYLSSKSAEKCNDSFTIPLNRQELADYLTVDRSALSTELGKLRDEGILSFNKNRFCLFKQEPVSGKGTYL